MNLVEEFPSLSRVHERFRIGNSASKLLRPRVVWRRAADLVRHFERQVLGYGYSRAKGEQVPLLVAARSLRHFRLLRPYLVEAGFCAAAVLIDAGAEDCEGDWPTQVATEGGEDVPVLPLSEYHGSRMQDVTEPLHVVVADGGDGVAFRSLAPRVASLLGPNQRLLHPAFLADFLDHDLSRSVVAYGYPGSGNVIVQKIMTTLLAPYRAGRFDQLEAWCASGHMVLCDFIREALSETGFGEVAIGYGQPGFLTVYASEHPNQIPRLYLPRVPSKICWAEHVYGTHCPPQPDDVDRLNRLAAHVVIVVRHPLDTIVSMAAKQAMTMTDAIMAESGCSISEARDTATAKILARGAELAPVLCEFRAFLQAATNLISKATVLRYEDLFARPEEFVGRLADILGVKVSAETVAELTSLVGTTNLGPPMHLHKPGTGKWRQQLGAESLALIQSSGLLQYAKVLGYGGSEFEAAASDVGDTDNVELGVTSFSHMYCLDEPQVRARVDRHDFIAEVAGFEVSSESEELIGLWRHKMKTDPSLPHLMRSMAL